jgi:hypothetical protein
MTLLSARRLPLWVALLAGAFGGCGDGCCTDPVNSIATEPKCVPQAEECEGNEAFRFGACQASGCSSDADCCPGSRCRSDINACFPLLLDAQYECTTSTDCPDPAQRCVETTIGARSPIPTCVFELCAGEGDCGFGRTCFEGRCIEKVPCGGSCPDGTACDVISGQCTSVPDVPTCAKGCEGLRVLKDPDTMSGEVCCEIACECKDKPPLVPVRWGKYSRVAVTLDEVLVSNYDSEYGDLVVARYKSDGSFVKLDYVDGVPAGGVVIANPDGPRGGTEELGPNVGTHTSIATDTTGNARVAYHDVENGALKVAIETDGGWATHTVDAGQNNAVVGMFTDVVVAANGTIWVSYLAHGITNAPGINGAASALKVAKSRAPNPATSADWDLFVVDARAIVDSCNNSCGANQACVLQGGAGACLPTSDQCAENCSSTRTCVMSGAGAECLAAPLPPESPEVPRARGLYSSIALDGSDPVVAYYDLVDGDVRAARVSQTGTATVFVVDGDGATVNGTAHKTGDVGRFPSVAKVGADLFIAYEDASRHELRVWQGTTPGGNGSYTTIDTGAQPGRSGKLFVGASTRLAKNTTTPVVVYQDASMNDLKLATPAGSIWAATPLSTDGAHGYYADVAVENGNAYIVSLLAELDGRGIERSRLGLTIQPAP